MKSVSAARFPVGLKSVEGDLLQLSTDGLSFCSVTVKPSQLNETFSELILVWLLQLIKLDLCETPLNLLTSSLLDHLFPHFSSDWRSWCCFCLCLFQFTVMCEIRFHCDFLHPADPRSIIAALRRVTGKGQKVLTVNSFRLLIKLLLVFCQSGREPADLPPELIP